MEKYAKYQESSNPLIQKLAKIILEKETNLCLSCDETKAEKVLELAEKLGPHLCMLKTHVDIIEDFSEDFIKKLKEISIKHNFLIFEDRKFADIGNTVSLQYQKGMYKISSWADIVNTHTVPGPGIIQGLEKVAKEESKERGLIVLAQMTPEGTLAEGEYTEKSIKMSNQFPDFVIGYIASSQPEEIQKLRNLAGDGMLLFSPGVKLEAGMDSMGQRYSTPQDVIPAGTDVIIVGRGIYQSENPTEEAMKYKKAAWEAASSV